MMAGISMSNSGSRWKKCFHTCVPAESTFVRTSPASLITLHHTCRGSQAACILTLGNRLRCRADFLGASLSHPTSNRQFAPYTYTPLWQSSKSENETCVNLLLPNREPSGSPAAWYRSRSPFLPRLLHARDTKF